MNIQDNQLFREYVFYTIQGEDLNLRFNEDEVAANGYDWGIFDPPNTIVLSEYLFSYGLLFALFVFYHELQHWKFEKVHNLPWWTGGPMIPWVEELFCHVSGFCNAIVAYINLRLEENNGSRN